MNQENIYSTTQSVRQHVFHKEEFHYLNVPKIGLLMVYDVFDCTFECLSNHLCFSVNLAVFKGVDGRLWCELLSSDKYRNFTQFKGNKSAHHFFIRVRSFFKHKSFRLRYSTTCAARFISVLTTFSSFYSGVLVLLRLVKTEEPA